MKMTTINSGLKGLKSMIEPPQQKNKNKSINSKIIFCMNINICHPANVVSNGGESLYLLIQQYDIVIQQYDIIILIFLTILQHYGKQR